MISLSDISTGVVSVAGVTDTPVWAATISLLVTSVAPALLAQMPRLGVGETPLFWNAWM